MFRLFITVAEAALVVTAVPFAVFVAAVHLASSHIELTQWEQAIVGFMIAVLPACLCAWWLFRRLKSRQSRPEARTGAKAFAISAPIGLLLGMLMGELTGGYSEYYLGTVFTLPGIVLGVFVSVAVVSFFSVAFAQKMRRLEEKVSQDDAPSV